MLRIALAQINPCVGDIAGNSRKILDSAARAGQRQADLVIFPEMALTGYPPEDLLLKPHFVQDNMTALRALAKARKGMTALIGFVDAGKDKELYNAAALISDGTIRGVYHKQVLPNYGVFDEKRYFREGNKPGLFLLGNVPIGVSICEDFWNQGQIPRDQAKAGAKVLINISSSPYDFGKFEKREKLLVERAVRNKAYVCYCNVVGGQDELVFDGASMVYNPFGKILAAGQQFEEDLILADLALPDQKPAGKVAGRFISLSHFKANKNKDPLMARPLEPLTKVERIDRALVLGTRDYMRKNGFQKAVIGLSGGIDSSLVAAIAVSAIGKDNVVGVSMPSEFSSQETRADARITAKNLGIRLIEVPIDEIFQTFLKVLEKEFQGTHPGVAEENIQARIRGNILMAFSNKFGWLVLTTGNKSEIAVGYCTLYGDMTGGFAVIKDVPKTMVYELVHFINARQGQAIPESVVQRAPTAELRKGQKDEDSLPPYAVLDPILKAYVEDHESFAVMAGRFKDAGMVKDVMRLVDRSEYKRRQSPPGIKISPRAFGKDWRLPITHKYKNFDKV